jgi:CRP-like cAMP-binding protein
VDDSRVTAGTNRLLSALPAVRRDRLMGSLRHVYITPRAILLEPGQAIEVVDFPRDCLVSLVAPLNDGRIVEVASLGNEGIVGVPVVLGGSIAVRAVCSVGGWVDRMAAITFIEAVEHDPDLRDVVDDYLGVLFNQLAQSVACNRLHTTTERLARWLLSADDRLGRDVITITRELLGELLGSSQPAVGRSAERLQQMGLIKNRRGRMTVVNRGGLEAVTCECYGVVRAELNAFTQRSEVRLGRARGAR